MNRKTTIENNSSWNKKNEGFTLVELIIVLVILAILAAILVPALLGYIDEAKQKQDLLSAKNCLTAVQSELSKIYAIAKVAFIGGSFYGPGGHNPLEANIWNKPVVSGYNVTNFKYIYKLSYLQDITSSAPVVYCFLMTNIVFL